MSLITRIPGVTFTDNTLPKLYRDSIITPGTKWLYDAGDTYSFAKQATPTPGTDVWKSLTETPADAAFAGALAFANGGFNFTNAGTDKIFSTHLCYYPSLAGRRARGAKVFVHRSDRGFDARSGQHVSAAIMAPRTCGQSSSGRSTGGPRLWRVRQRDQVAAASLCDNVA